MELVDLFVQFGLTRQEAHIYIALLTEGEMNGYEIAKKTGISRSNTYTSAAALVDKGGAYIAEGAVTRYTPVPIEEFCNNKIRKLSEIRNTIIKGMPGKKAEVQGYITIHGQRHILDKMKNMLVDAKERVYISASGRVLQLIADEIRKAADRGIKVVLITDNPFAYEGITVHLMEKTHLQIRLITDSSNVLTGDLEAGEQCTCLYSQKRNLIDLIKDSLKNEIKLAELRGG